MPASVVNSLLQVGQMYIWTSSNLLGGWNGAVYCDAQHNYLQNPFSTWSGYSLERQTGLEPATARLEIWNSTN